MGNADSKMESARIFTHDCTVYFQ